MTYRVVYAPEAEAQLEDLYLYIAEQGSAVAALSYVNAVIDTCEALSLFPHRAVPRDDVRPGLRVTHHKGRAVIAFTVEERAERVVVLGVFYGGQDYAAAFAFETDD